MTRFATQMYIQALPNGEVRVIEAPIRNSGPGPVPDVYNNGRQVPQKKAPYVGNTNRPQSSVAEVHPGYVSTPLHGWPLASTVTNSPTVYPTAVKSSVWAAQIVPEITSAAKKWPQKALFYTPTTSPAATSTKRMTTSSYATYNPTQSVSHHADWPKSYQNYLQNEVGTKLDYTSIVAAKKVLANQSLEMTPTVPNTVGLITDSLTAPPPDATARKWSDFFGSSQNPLPGPTPLPVNGNNREQSSGFDELKRAKHQGVIIGAVLGSVCGLIILTLLVIICLNYRRWQRFRREKQLYGLDPKYDFNSDPSQSSSSQGKQYYQIDDSVDTVKPPGVPVESPFDDVDLLKINKAMGAPRVPPQNTSRISRLYQACMRSTHPPTRIVSAPSGTTDPLNIPPFGLVPRRPAPSPPGQHAHCSLPVTVPNAGRSFSFATTINDHTIAVADKNQPSESLLSEIILSGAESDNETAQSNISSGTKRSGIYHLSAFTSPDEWGALRQFLFKSPNNSIRSSQNTQEKRAFWRKDPVSSLSIRKNSTATSLPSQAHKRSSSIYSYYDIDELDQIPPGIKSRNSSFSLPVGPSQSTSFDFACELSDHLLASEPTLPTCHVIHEESDTEYHQ